VHKPVGPNDMQPRVLKELADVVVKTLSIVFRKSSLSSEIPSDGGKKGKITHIFKKGGKEYQGNYRLMGLTSIPGKTVKQSLLEDMLRHMYSEDVVRDSQHSFTKGKL